MNLSAMPLVAGTSFSLEEWVVGTALPASLEGRALALVDFDLDGDSDLVVGYRLQDEGILMVFPRDPASTWPHLKDQLTPPFHQRPIHLLAPKPVDYLGTGDFDGDGLPDLVAATLGEAQLHWWSGRDLKSVQTIHLSGQVTAFVVGEIALRDNLPDLAVAIRGQEGHEVLLFQSSLGAFYASPERLHLNNAVEHLSLASFDDHPGQDLLIQTEDGLKLASADLSWSVQATGSRFSLAPFDGVKEKVVNHEIRLPARLNRDGVEDAIVLRRGDLWPTLELSEPAATYTVNVVDDTDDGLCDALHCSLREAILAANASVGEDAIEFDLTGPAPFSIVFNASPGYASPHRVFRQPMLLPFLHRLISTSR